MTNNFIPAELVRTARERAEITQRELARRAGTAQSVVARIERQRTNPTVATLKGLLNAAGFNLRTELTLHTPVDSHMLDDVERILGLTPEDRLIEVRNFSRFEAAAQRA